MKLFVLFVAIFSLLATTACGADLICLGNWAPTIKIGSPEFPKSPGDLVSPSNAYSLSIVRTDSEMALWKVRVSLGQTADLPEGASIWVRRSGPSLGKNDISGGTSWKQVTPTDTPFVSGQGAAQNIPLQVLIRDIDMKAYRGKIHLKLIFRLEEIS